MGKNKADRIFILLVTMLVLTGIFVFASASLGILAKNESIFMEIVANQFLFGLVGGLFAFTFTSKVNYNIWKKYSLFLIILSLILTASVFLPVVGLAHGGARRWLDLGFASFQPGELLKLGLVVYLSAWFSSVAEKTGRKYYAVISLFLFLTLATIIMLKQPDTGTFIVMVMASLAVYFAYGAKWKHIIVICLVGIVGLAVLVTFKPYLMDRLQTFISPSRDPSGSSYQIRQSLLAIGSGEIFGRGLGQSVQKFNYLPEPVGDSVFAIVGEELGFVGGTILVLIFLLFGLRGLKIASKAPDLFGKYLSVGIIVLIISQSFLNISSLIGIFPLTGVPLTFISHGGTALFFALAEVGIVVNISTYAGRA